MGPRALANSMAPLAECGRPNGMANIQPCARAASLRPYVPKPVRSVLLNNTIATRSSRQIRLFEPFHTQKMKPSRTAFDDGVPTLVY